MEQSTINKHVVSVTKLSGTWLGIELLRIEHKGDNYFAGNIYIEALREIAELREAGEKMATQLKDLRGFQEEAEARGQSSITVETEYIFNTDDAAALGAWEAANK